MKKLELTFAIIKPHIIKNLLAFEGIRSIILESHFKVVKSKIKPITQEEAERFYEEHKHKFFYNRLVTFMTSGPSGLYILAHENAIKRWRELMGPTKVFRAQFEAPHTIRGQFGLSDTRNATHGSDSPESVLKEIGVFFPEFDIDNWYKKEEESFRNNNVTFAKEKFVHLLNEQ